MRAKFVIGAFIFCFSICSLKAETVLETYKKYEYIGTIQLLDKSLITYKIIFEEIGNNQIKGKSITDFSGAHRTESIIEGTINKKRNKISFSEKSNISTKSDFEESTFCYIHIYNANIKLKKRKSVIQGHFYSRYADGTLCLEGDLYLMSEDFYFKKMDKLSKKKIIPAEDKASIKAMVDNSKRNLKQTILSHDENLNIKTKDEIVKLKIWDAEHIDGDRVTIMANGIPYLENKLITTEGETITIKLKEQLTTIEIIAVNVGKIPPNSARISIYNNDKDLPIKLRLNKNDSCSIVVERI